MDWQADGTMAAPSIGAPWQTTKETRRRLQRFRAARRHSRLVRILRRLLPVSGVLVIVAIGLAVRLAAPGDFDVSVARTTVTRNSVIMENPRLSGFDRFNREYTVTADTATQLLSAPDEVVLDGINAHLILPGRGTADVIAAAGTFNNAQSKLDLRNGVEVRSSEGYALHMQDADIDMKGGTLATSKPVRIEYQDSVTVAEGLHVSEGGEVIVLDGNVRTNLMPPKRAAATGTGETEEPQPGDRE
ncbi:LPS export ABC transporter periplasmic protein LptC [Propylenella binzhouense]|uniref:LPS export ABC transporter periplasmic protein LptC n=1 Tax=Propylenella binzhouense TaxID=2555902 RepID=A0A964T535_9HYPH|nr:LPS export ABC transporter periplasmic protein LptC [Propylenella binzhouense]MYZ47637.1 LPS export ABC transporter periplasmic protein LptC [Propylenella binzhouense]